MLVELSRFSKSGVKARKASEMCRHVNPLLSEIGNSLNFHTVRILKTIFSQFFFRMITSQQAK